MRQWMIYAAFAVAATAPLSLARQPDLDTIVVRASRFAEQQRDVLVRVRADEHYTQETRLVNAGVLQKRLLESEMAFVRLSNSNDWVAFRNVVKVDGVGTGADASRLEKLFREGATTNQGLRIVEENSVYNIGRLQRTLNIPIFPLHLLMPDHIGRFKFRKVAEERGRTGGVWVVGFEERQSPTVVQLAGRGDVPLRGRMWLETDTGKLLKATLQANHPVMTELQFTWRHDANLDAWVPAEMRERYSSFQHEQWPGRFYDINAVATYSNYRRFDVDVRIR